jgi:hypothetical protein
MKETKPKTYTRQLKKLMQMHRQVAFYDFMLEKGKEFKEHFTLNYKDRKVLDWLQRRRPKIKGCYYNSQMLILDNKELKYFEGFATTKTLGLPLEHAWCVYKDKIVDVTWKENGDEYFGVEIPIELVRKTICDTGKSITILDRYFFKENGKK